MKFLLSFVIFGLFALASAQEEDDDAMEVGGAIVIDGKEIREKRALGRIYTGSACEYIKLSDITANSGCVDGTKFVIKKDDTVRKQLLIMSGTPILAFVTKNTKFANCSSFTEVTMQVDCKTVDGLSDVDLSANSSSSGIFATLTPFPLEVLHVCVRIRHSVGISSPNLRAIACFGAHKYKSGIFNPHI